MRCYVKVTDSIYAQYAQSLAHPTYTWGGGGKGSEGEGERESSQGSSQFGSESLEEGMIPIRGVGSDLTGQVAAESWDRIRKAQKKKTHV